MAEPVQAEKSDGCLDIYFIDVEGGAATLLVTPQNESLLIDSVVDVLSFMGSVDQACHSE